MEARSENQSTGTKGGMTVERKSDRELVVTRIINAPARIVFEAWSKPELFKQWWVPKSCGVTLLSCEMDPRVGGKYCLTFAHGDSKMEFFGKYVEVIPPTRLAWTNDEGGEGGAVTTVTFEEKAGKTLVIMHELYASKEALDAAMTSGEKDGMAETFDQLDSVLVALAA